MAKREKTKLIIYTSLGVCEFISAFACVHSTIITVYNITKKVQATEIIFQLMRGKWNEINIFTNLYSIIFYEFKYQSSNRI